MLITDSDCLTTADLAAVDPECSKVAASQNPPITLDGAGSIIRQTLNEACSDITARFQNFSGYLVSPGINLAHMAAVSNILSTSISRPRMRLNQVVAIGPDPSRQDIKLWLTHSALRALYRAAYARFTKDSDRFERKMDFYATEEIRVWRNIESSGVPVVLSPIPCPGAIREPNAGAWGQANVTAGGSGSTETGNSYFVAITWTGVPYVSQTNKANAESGPSATVQISVAAAQVLSVSIVGLNPPSSTTPNVGTADGLYTQIPAAGWNIYVGMSADAMYLQNATPLALTTTSHALADAPVLSGYVMGLGQACDFNFSSQRMLHRA